MLELYDIPGRGLALYDPKDPCLPKGAVRFKPLNEEPKPEPKPKTEKKAVKPKNKAVKAETK